MMILEADNSEFIAISNSNDRPRKSSFILRPHYEDDGGPNRISCVIAAGVFVARRSIHGGSDVCGHVLIAVA
jgi:hypothetical protein